MTQAEPVSPDNMEAAWRCTVPGIAVAAIEHPCILKSTDRAVQSLGGAYRISKFLDNRDDARSIGLSLRPNDPLARPVESRQVAREGVLLKITVPRRTGRKRLKGSSQEFRHEQDGERTMESSSREAEIVSDAGLLLETMRELPERCNIQALGRMKESHQFRFVPDMQFSTSTDTTMEKMRHTLLKKNLPGIADFAFDPRRTLREGETIEAPAKFTPALNFDIPFYFYYKQNPNVYFDKSEGGLHTSRNRADPGRFMNNVMLPGDPTPFEMPEHDGVTPEHQLTDKFLIKTIRRLRKALEERPIMSKRVINCVLGLTEYHHRGAWVYVGYLFRSGPWKDLLIRFGVDPRSDPKWRFYQSEMFKLDLPKDQIEDYRPKGAEKIAGHPKTVSPVKVKDRHAYTFDGKFLWANGKVWQFCDIEDELLKEVINTTHIRKECDSTSGWYYKGTLAKLRTFMKFKIRGLLAGYPIDDAVFARVKRFPEVMVTDARSTLAWLRQYAPEDKRVATKLEIDIASDLRTLATSSQANRESHQVYEQRGEASEGEDDGVEEEETDGESEVEVG